MRGGSEEGAWRSRSPGDGGGQVVPENPARGSAGSERHVVQRPLVEPGDSPPRKGPSRLRRGENPAPLSPRTSVRGGSGEGARRSSSPGESSGGKCRLGAPRRAAPVGRTRRQPPAQRALEAPPGRDPCPSPPPHIYAGRQLRRGSAVKKPRGGVQRREVSARSATSCSARWSNPATAAPLQGPSKIRRGETPGPLRPQTPVGCVRGASEERARMSSRPGDCVVILY